MFIGWVNQPMKVQMNWRTREKRKDLFIFFLFFFIRLVSSLSIFFFLVFIFGWYLMSYVIFNSIFSFRWLIFNIDWLSNSLIHKFFMSFETFKQDYQADVDMQSNHDEISGGEEKDRIKISSLVTFIFSCWQWWRFTWMVSITSQRTRWWWSSRR